MQMAAASLRTGGRLRVDKTGGGGGGHQGLRKLMDGAATGVVVE